MSITPNARAPPNFISINLKFIFILTLILEIKKFGGKQ